MSKHILLDRDGVINRRLTKSYVIHWTDFEFLPGALDALRLLGANDYKVIVISNQAGVGKGLMSSEELNGITGQFVSEVERHRGRVESVYYCPHREEDRCRCRKPNPGLLVEAQQEHRFVFADTFMVGDSETDALAAREVGCPVIRVANDEMSAARHWTHQPQATVTDLREAVQFILALHR